MFKTIECISDVQPFVAGKKEIRFNEQPNGVTIGCYQFMDGDTFDTLEALECRGIAFDGEGRIVSRPLHKFFNVGEKAWLLPEEMARRDDIAAIFEKIDGSMIATAWVNDALEWRSKKTFDSSVVKIAKRIATDNPDITEFAESVASNGMTAIFEVTHPDARIVVGHDIGKLRLLHVRDNVSGEYVMLNPAHPIHGMIDYYGVEVVRRFDEMTFSDAIESLAGMKDSEGYVVQFASGDMAKIKCPWYLRLHKSVTFLRERSIATLALHEELDDVKGALVEAGIDLSQVEEVEARLKGKLLEILDQVDAVYEADGSLERKDFAIKHKANPFFGLIMSRYIGRPVEVAEWYERNRLKDDFSLRVLADDAVAEAMEA